MDLVGIILAVQAATKATTVVAMGASEFKGGIQVVLPGKWREQLGGTVWHHAHRAGKKQDYKHHCHKPHQHFSGYIDIKRANESNFKGCEVT